ncbi:hypothetical protein CCY99_03545 [Helicobacter sp. 16-1353]|uniref:GTPase n=1 Tax=Helicobacter sp. 16-1353 TaxID=2004996 RepID=UPI000DCDAC55|nr:GTPase [Helicobacter sp. 16-1353]RAX54434.1 hypothetical protein CCY99_03545 [Helicobacter sp. 16-1353]
MINDKNDYRKIKDEVTQVAQKVCESSEIEKFISHIDSKIRDFRQTMIIYGEYNTGKSTLINALFGKEVAKMGDAPETKEVHEYLYNGYTIFDTPGINVDNKDDLVTKEQLEKSEIVLFVISTDGSLEVEFVYEKIGEVVKAKKPIILVLNNKNGINPNSLQERQIINKVYLNLERIGKLNDIEEIENKISVYIVNAKEALKAKIENKHRLLSDSQILGLESAIDDCLTKSGHKEVVNALNQYIRNFINNMLETLDNKIDNKESNQIETLITLLKKQQESLNIELEKMVNNELVGADSRILEILLSQQSSIESKKSDIEKYLNAKVSNINEKAINIMKIAERELRTKTDEFLEFSTPNATTNLANIEAPSSDIFDEILPKIIEQVKAFIPTIINEIGGKAGWTQTLILIVSAILDMFNSYQKEERQKTMQLEARSKSQSEINKLKEQLINGYKNCIKITFDGTIDKIDNKAKQLKSDNSELLEMKNKLFAIIDRLS